MTLKEYLKHNILVTDGAMGTYFSTMAGTQTTISELANLESPSIIQGIHRAYIEAGAQLIRTNTFSANTLTLDKSRRDIGIIIKKGFEIAQSASKEQEVFIAADIGPVPEMKGNKALDRNFIRNEYIFIVDTFLDLGAENFVFETFSSTDYIGEITGYIKSKNPHAFILVQFALNAEGYTRKGISAKRIQSQIKKIPYIDGYGFNCGIGPAHLYKIIKNLDFSKDIVSALPNSGYPVVINERTVYTHNPGYFADKSMDLKNLGIKIIGGCCGTSPTHIKRISELLITEPITRPPMPKIFQETKPLPVAEPNTFRNKVESGKFVIAAELDPPFSANLDRIIGGARELRDGGVDIITVADSPMARPRTDSIMVASKIKRETGIDAMPHICCRDKNIIALKSSLLGAYMEDIRNLLIITGDPIPSPERNDIKSVFNLNSMKLMEMIDEMNQDLFAYDPYFFAGAVNLNAYNKDVEWRRLKQKARAGAGFFLTQPIYTDDAIEYLKGANGEKDIRILAGIMPPVSYKNAMFLNNEVPGIDIPRNLIDRFSPDMSRREGEDIGVEIAVALIDKIKDYVSGIYFIAPFNRTGMITKIIRESLD
ncbi:MAG: bifunctional homocysteine S-methyltransferase/methylenetetrahydrofolate reductase [Clostridiales bacterium]|nr:bifunctional homocysteine S-methyltransferase/methylenetetrahydrofolate reductase [Clostridiales bacterium]